MKPDLEITAAGLRINRAGGLWRGRIIDAAIAQSLAHAGLDDLRPSDTTTLSSTVAALANLQDEPEHILNEQNK